MKIPISKIRENPNNPRHVFNQTEDDSLAASMQKQGQLAPCVVKQTTPDSFQLISGARRLRAAIKNGWTELECEVTDRSEGDEAIELSLFNGGKKLFWLEEYEGIEYARSKNPKMTQKELADRLALTQQKVSCAKKALSLLNKPAREAIYRIAVKNDEWKVPERMVLVLIEIATGQPDDQNRVEQALGVVIERKMTIKDVEKLKDWVRKGNSPDTFPEDGKTSKIKGAKNQRFDPDDPNAGTWEHMPKTYRVSMAKDGYEARIKLNKESAVLVLSAARAWKKELENRRSGVTGRTNEFMDALPGLLEASLKQEPAPAVKVSNPIPPDSPDGQAEPGTGMEMVKNMAKGILKNSAPEGIVGNILKAGLKKFLK